MKVLVVSKYFYPVLGGVESVVYYVARRLVEDGIDITVIASGNEHKKETIEGIKVIRVPTWSHFGGAPVSPGIFWEVLKQDFDVLHLHEPNNASNPFTLFALLFKKKKPLVITYHSDIIMGEVRSNIFFKILKSIYLNTFARILCNRAEVIMPTSPNYVEISDTLPKYRNKLKVVPNGVDLKKFKPGKEREKKEHNILFVGRLIYYKGLQYLINAMPIVSKKVPDAKFIVVGDGPLKEEWQDLAKKIRVDKSVEWRGRLSNKEMVKEYQRCGVFVLPSIHKSEAFGIVLLEAIACGAPVITTDISGTVYAAGDAGIVIKPRDEKTLAESIIRVLTDDKMAEEMRKKGLKRIKNFDWNRIAEKVEGVYEEVLR